MGKLLAQFRRHHIVFFVILFAAGSVQSQYAFPAGEKYFGLGLYELANHDGFKTQSVLTWTVGYPLGNSGLTYEWQRPTLASVRYDGVLDEDRVTSTWLVMGCILAPVAWTMAAAGSDDSSITKTAMTLMAPFGSHLAYRPTRFLTIYAGMIPEVLLFTEANGIVAQTRMGLRADVGLGLTLTAGVQKPYFFVHERPDRQIDAAVFIGVTYFSPRGSALLD